MFDQLQAVIKTDALWVLERLTSAEDDTDRAYYQGQIDALAQVRRHMASLEKASA